MLGKICDSIDGKKITEVVVGLIVVGFISWLSWGVHTAVDEKAYANDKQQTTTRILDLYTKLVDLAAKMATKDDIKTLKDDNQRLEKKLDLALERLPLKPPPPPKPTRSKP